jgi:hypothetical protein
VCSAVRCGGASRYHPICAVAGVVLDVRRGSVAAMQRVFNARVRRKLPSKRLTEMTHCNLISSHSRALS